MNNKTLPAKTSTWSGYNLDELRYERVIALTRIEIEKAKLLDTFETTRESLPIVGTTSASTIFKSISKLEYLIGAFKIYRKLAPLFKKKNSKN